VCVCVYVCMYVYWPEAKEMEYHNKCILVEYPGS
jgi:hypothetical protein